jgi:putative flippase GtrA
MSGQAITAGVSGPGPGLSLCRLLDRFPTVQQISRYAVAGGLSTVANAGMFLVLRNWLDAVPANLVALVLSTALSTELHRWFTFRATDSHRWRAHLQTGGTVLFYAFYSSAVLLVVEALVVDPSPWLESAAVAAASLFGGLCRFLLLRHWVFENRDPGP